MFEASVDGFGGAVAVDVDLGDMIVQVKSGNARVITGQIAKTEATTIDERSVTLQISRTIPGNAARNGVPIARTTDELVAMAKEFG
ncbi:MAG: hypothetical protein U0Q15_12935 [Kineosporiaceae bacterium]